MSQYEYEDEGFDEYQDHFPFWNAANHPSSAPQHSSPHTRLFPERIETITIQSEDTSQGCLESKKINPSSELAPLTSPGLIHECFPSDFFFGRSKPSARKYSQHIWDKSRFSTSDTAQKSATYHDQDSVLHYFIATNESELLLDKYVQGIISVFMGETGPIHAGPVDTSSTLTPLVSPSIDHRDPNRIMEQYLRWLKVNVVDNATRTFSSQMIGHMTSALPYFHRPLARLLVALNQNVVKLETASTLTSLERHTISMLHQSFYAFDTHFYDTYAPQNIAWAWNLALKADPSRGCRGVAVEGFFPSMTKYGYKGAVIIGSRLLHYSFKKAADLLGLGEDGLCLVPVTSTFQIRIDVLKEEIRRCKKEGILVIAVVGIAGTTEAGSIDPLQDMASICKTENIHFHVDAAWGGPLIFSQDHRQKLNGINEADTITVDGHKQFYTPMGLGLVLTKSPHLAQTIQKTANYVIRADSADMGKFTLEGSRPANIIYLHASLHLLGKRGLGTLLTRSCTLTKQMAVRLESHPTGAFQVLHEPMSNLLLYRFLPPRLRQKQTGSGDKTRKTSLPFFFSEMDEFEISEYTRQIQAYQSESKDPNVGFVSRTRVLVRTDDTKERLVDVFRVVIANPLTCWSDIENVISTQLWFGRQAETVVEKRCRDERIRVFHDGIGATTLPSAWVTWPFEF